MLFLLQHRQDSFLLSLQEQAMKRSVDVKAGADDTGRYTPLHSAAPPPFVLPFSHVCKTSHTCLLVSGEFLSSVVFPAGACFSRSKDMHVCHCMHVTLQLLPR